MTVSLNANTVGGSTGGGGGIKSIQRGTVTATRHATGTVTISTVDTTKSVLHINTRNGHATYNAWGDSEIFVPSMALTNSTTLTWNTNATSGSDSVVSANIEWQLVEYL